MGPSKITGMSPGEVPEIDRGALQGRLRLGAPRLVAELAALIRIPSVSWDGFDAAHVERSAEAVRSLLADTGMFDTVGVYSHRGGQPAVIARKEPDPGALTVVLYAHHDVQPPGEDGDWDSGAFEPSVRHGRLYGRGSADDKAGIAVHLAAIRALQASLGSEDLRLGLVVFVEGEEENGSPSFSGFLETHRALLTGDVIIVADSDNPSPDLPAITTSLRGNVTAVLTVKTLTHAVHSGMFGGVLPDAMTVLVTLGASFWDASGSVAIEGLRPQQMAEEVKPEEAPGLLEGVGQLGRGTVSDRLWNQSALTITGVDAPSVAHASNTLVPEASAKVSLRVPPGVSASVALSALETHIRAHIPFGAHWELTDVSLGEAFSMGHDEPALRLCAQALESAFGVPAIFQGVGGSIPFISQLAEAFPAAQIVVTGVEDPDTRAHSPNESLHLGVLWRAALAQTIFLAELNRREISDFLSD